MSATPERLTSIGRGRDQRDPRGRNGAAKGGVHGRGGGERPAHAGGGAASRGGGDRSSPPLPETRPAGARWRERCGGASLFFVAVRRNDRRGARLVLAPRFGVSFLRASATPSRGARILQAETPGRTPSDFRAAARAPAPAWRSGTGRRRPRAGRSLPTASLPRTNSPRAARALGIAREPRRDPERPSAGKQRVRPSAADGTPGAASAAPERGAAPTVALLRRHVALEPAAPV